MKDAAFISLYGSDSGRTFDFYDVVADQSKHNEALKITDGASAITVNGKRIVGGAEDCADLNNGVQAIEIHFDEWHARGKYVVTVKGGSRNILLSGCIMAHGREADIDIGNHSDQSGERTKGVRLKLTTADGQPVKVRVLHGHSPVILNPEQAYVVDVRAKGFFGHLWPLLKKLAAFFGKKL